MKNLQKKIIFLLLFSTILYLIVPGVFRAELKNKASDSGSLPLTFLTNGSDTETPPFIPRERSFTRFQIEKLSKVFGRSTAVILFLQTNHLPWASLSSELGRCLFSSSRSAAPIWLICLALLI